MTAHTPGPWFVDWDHRGGWNHHVMSSPDDRVCFMANGTNLDQQERCNADARLIAAAPEMLSALETCADLLWSYGGDQSSDDGWKTEELREACLAARNAIAKAKGRS